MSKIKAIHTLKESIIEQKFIAGESEDHITEWSQQIEGSLKVADEEALSVRNLIAKIEKENRAAAKMESDKQEMALHPFAPESAKTGRPENTSLFLNRPKLAVDNAFVFGLPPHPKGQI